ncbi:MAG: zeta toxin family protein [Fibromonadaceae bacterium]|jgi:predicted ABC-type ATPase|nr:zeta toxin family protein [Fibromonadaceae bacterium]
MTSIAKPYLYIISGPNGSGKTTLAKELLENENLEFLNADEIAKSINPNDVSKVYMQAGREFFRKMDEYLEQGKSFAIETTLSGKYHKRMIERFKQSGYEIKMLYIFLDSPNLCIDRINIRVSKGGHSIPDEDVIRRFFRSKNNFFDIKNSIDQWFLYFNGGEKYIEVAQGVQNNMIIFNEELYNLFLGDANG